MSRISVEHNPPPQRLGEMDVANWPIWEKEKSKFPWSYDATETFYVLEGEVTITPDGGESVRISKGDLVCCPSGMSCTWEVHSPIRKHYKMDW